MLRLIGSIIGALLNHCHARCVRLEAPQGCVFSALLLRVGPNYCAEDVACPLNTASIAAWAHFSPSPLDTPIAPMTWLLTTTGSAPGCGKSCMNVGAKFSPLRTILLVSEVGRRQRKADFAFNSAVSIAFIAAPSMAWDSMRLPPQSRIAIATTCLFCWAQAVQASAKARAPALEMTLTSLVALRSLVACLAGAERVCC